MKAGCDLQVKVGGVRVRMTLRISFKVIAPRGDGRVGGPRAAPQSGSSSNRAAVLDRLPVLRQHDAHDAILSDSISFRSFIASTMQSG